MVPTHVCIVPHMYYMTLMIPSTLYGIGILWSPLPYMEQVSYGPHTCMYSPPHVLYDSYGLPYLIWNRYHMVLPHVCMVLHMWSVFMSYMTLMVLHTLYGIGILWSPTCTYGPITCMIWCQWHWSPHILYGIGIWWSPLPYMEEVSYGPHMYVWPTHMYDLMVTLLPYMEQVSYGPPTCRIWFFKDSFERGPLHVLANHFLKLIILMTGSKSGQNTSQPCQVNCSLLTTYLLKIWMWKSYPLKPEISQKKTWW